MSKPPDGESNVFNQRRPSKEDQERARKFLAERDAANAAEKARMAELHAQAQAVLEALRRKP